MGFFDKLKKITTELFGGFTEADEAFFEELEETLILADLGMDTALGAVEKLRQRVRKEKLRGQEEVRSALRDILAEEMDVGDTSLDSFQPAQRGAVHRRQRRGKDHLHRQAGLSAEKQREAGAVLRGGYLPGSRRRPAADLGGTGGVRTGAPA